MRGPKDSELLSSNPKVIYFILEFAQNALKANGSSLDGREIRVSEVKIEKQDL